MASSTNGFEVSPRVMIFGLELVDSQALIQNCQIHLLELTDVIGLCMDDSFASHCISYGHTSAEGIGIAAQPKLTS